MMDASSFKKEALKRELNQEAIDILYRNNIMKTSVLMLLKHGDVDKLQMNVGNRVILEKWIYELKVEQAGGPRSPMAADMHFEGQSTSRIPGTGASIQKNTTDVFIGVSGLTRSGKSSLVNALRGLGNKDDQAARVGGQVQTHDLSTKKYVIPSSEHHYLLDLPPVDSVDDIKDYLDIINIDILDAIIICSSERLDEQCLDLAADVHASGKPFIVVRTRIDVAVESDREDYEQQHDETRFLEKIKKEILGQLTKKSLPGRVYLVSNRPGFQNKWDMLNVKDYITRPVPKPEKQHVVSGHPNSFTDTKPKTADMPEQKKKEFLDAITETSFECGELSKFGKIEEMVTKQLELFHKFFKTPERRHDDLSDLMRRIREVHVDWQRSSKPVTDKSQRTKVTAEELKKCEENRQQLIIDIVRQYLTRAFRKHSKA